MSKIELFTEDNNNNNDTPIDDPNTENENTDDQNTENENTDDQNTDDQNTETDDNINQSKSLPNDTTDNEDNDEQDDDELDVDSDPEKAELNDLVNVDEQDDDELSDDDINNLINRTFGDDPSLDAIDRDIYVMKKPSDLLPNDGLSLDEKLTDLDVDEDGEDTLFSMSNAGKAALDQIGSVQEEGDELAALIIAVPIDFFTLTIEAVVKIIGATLEKPINNIDEYLGPIRQALQGLYNIVQPIVLLIDNMVGLPFSIGALLWSTLCNVFKVFGAKVSCNAKYEPPHIIMELFDAITEVNIFRIKDLIFNEEFRNNIIAAIRTFFTKIIETILLIIKAMSMIGKILENLIAGIKKIVELIEEVTTKENLQIFLIIIIMLAIGYILLFSSNKVMELIQ